MLISFDLFSKYFAPSDKNLNNITIWIRSNSFLDFREMKQWSNLQFIIRR